MLTQATMQALRALGLVGMAEAVLAQAHQPDTQALSFDERFGLLVDHEWTYRQNRRLARRLQEAKLPWPPVWKTSSTIRRAAWTGHGSSTWPSARGCASIARV